jgi:hypothetical protein
MNAPSPNVNATATAIICLFLCAGLFDISI